MNPLLIASVIFMIAVLFVGSVYFAIWELPEREKRKKIKDRLESISEAGRRMPSPELDIMKSELLSDVPAFNRMLLQFSHSNQLKKLIGQADMKMKVSTLILVSLVLFAFGIVVSNQLLNMLPVNILIGLLLSALPFLVILYKRNRRFRKFEELFPEALELLTRAVKAGHAFNTGIEMIAEEMVEPISKEFRITFDEQNFGLPLKQALFNMVERMPLLDLKFFVTAVLMQKETGGNLAEILTNLSHLIRERFKIMGEVRTFSAQGRLTGYILTAVPIAMGFILSAMNWDYMSALFKEQIGHYMLAGAGFCQLLGYIIIRKIVNIKV
ncbi:MAG: type II secretion system F family protein [Acidobacteria bacterium]|nr:type II secretion system F family protein [Acidobacteriota bacterium]MCI0718510.1 type II secretion system F family protein [Acidobacteriota bacterium]